MDEGEINEHAYRLARAFSSAEPNAVLPHGAGDQDIELLLAGFDGLYVPAELIELLRVMNGSPESILLGEVGPLLSAADILLESRNRASIASNSESAFCPGWVVITSAGWTYSVVIAEAQPRKRSSVVDLSYGNLASPIVAASLTALVAASADAWEAGMTHLTQAWDSTEAGQQAFRERPPVLRELLAQRSCEFPSDDGLTAGDYVAPWRQAWPESWPGRTGPELIPVYAPHPLAVAIAKPGSEGTIVAVVVESRGRWTLVRDHQTEAWLDLPPRLTKGHDLRNGTQLMFSMLHPHAPLALLGIPSDGPRHALRVTGVFDAERWPSHDSF